MDLVGIDHLKDEGGDQSTPTAIRQALDDLRRVGEPDRSLSTRSRCETSLSE